MIESRELEREGHGEAGGRLGREGLGLEFDSKCQIVCAIAAEIWSDGSKGEAELKPILGWMEPYDVSSSGAFGIDLMVRHGACEYYLVPGT